MNKPQAFKAGRGCPVSVEIGNHDAFVIPEDYHADLALAVDEEPDLPVEFASQEGYLPRQIVADQTCRRDAPAVQTF